MVDFCSNFMCSILIMVTKSDSRNFLLFLEMMQFVKQDRRPVVDYILKIREIRNKIIYFTNVFNILIIATAIFSDVTPKNGFMSLEYCRKIDLYQKIRGLLIQSSWWLLVVSVNLRLSPTQEKRHLF